MYTHIMITSNECTTILYSHNNHDFYFNILKKILFLFDDLNFFITACSVYRSILSSHKKVHYYKCGKWAVQYISVVLHQMNAAHCYECQNVCIC